MRNYIPEKDPKFLNKSSFLMTQERLMLILVSINLEIICIYAPGNFVVGVKTFVLSDLEGREVSHSRVVSTPIVEVTSKCTRALGTTARNTKSF